MNTGNTAEGLGGAQARGGIRLALLCVAQFVVVLDVTIVAIALPAIRRDLGFEAADLQWVLSAYTLTFGGGLLLAGRVADLYGARRAFRAGCSSSPRRRSPARWRRPRPR
jgi:MFS family permease